MGNAVSGTTKKAKGDLRDRGIDERAAGGAVAGGFLGGAGGAFTGALGGGLMSERARAKAARKKKDDEFKKKQKRGQDTLFANIGAEKEALDAIMGTLNDPNATKDDVDSALAAVQKINTSEMTGRATTDVQRLRAIAETTGDTSIAKRLLEEQGLEEKTALEDLTLAGAQRGQSAFESLASRGGAGAGSRERLLAQTGRQSLLEQQRQKRQGQLQRAGLRSEDEGRKLGLATQLPGQELAIADRLRAAQQAQSAADLEAARLGAQASQFDVASSQAAQQFKVGKQLGITSGKFGKEQAATSAALLAAQQRKAAEDAKRSQLDKILSPSGTFDFSKT